MAWWLDRFELGWAYEPETLVDGPVSVTPDFWLPDIQTLVFVQTRVLPSDHWEASMRMVGTLGRRTVFLEMDRHVVGPMEDIPDPARLVTCLDGLFKVEPNTDCTFAEPGQGWFWHSRFAQSVSHIKQLASGAHVLLIRCTVCGVVHWTHRAGDMLCPRCQLGNSSKPERWQKHIIPALHLRTMAEVHRLVEQARSFSGA